MPSLFRQTARRDSFSVLPPSIRMIWCSATTRYTRLQRLSWRESRKFNASATNSHPLDYFANAYLNNHIQGLL